MNEIIIKFLASFLIWFMLAGLFVLWVIDGKIKKEQVLHAMVAVSIVIIFSEMVKTFFPVLRPFLVNGDKPLVFLTETDGSFPSSHTALAFSLATTIWLHDKKVGWIYMILAFIVGIARVLANVHYPLDILGGAFFGILAAFAVEKVHIRIKA